MRRAAADSEKYVTPDADTRRVTQCFPCYESHFRVTYEFLFQHACFSSLPTWKIDQASNLIDRARWCHLSPLW